MTLARHGEQVAIVKFTDAEKIEARKIKLRAKWKRRYWRNKEKIAAYKVLWRAKNKEKVLAQKKKWQQDNWPYRQGYSREWYLKNAERIKAKKRAEYQSNKAKYIESAKSWKLKNPEKAKAAQKLWLAKNRGRRLATFSKYMALKKKATVNLAGIKEFMAKVKSKPTAICYYCQNKVPTFRKLHFDHIVPISKGGHHSVENLCVSCGPCNNSKYDSFLHEWKKVGQQMLAL